MLRLRQVAAALERHVSATWDVIIALVADILDRSPHIAHVDVDAAMTVAAPVGMMLIAAGHLDRHPLVIVAPPLHLSVTTVSGTNASVVDENLAPVPGGASAQDWMIYLPTPEPLGDAVRQIAKASVHLSAEPPPETTDKAERIDADDVVDLDALARRKTEA